MKTIQKTMGWLVMAAALTIGTTACSSDDMLAENNEPTVMPQAQQKVHITVGAGVGTSGTTRSSVDYNSETKERTLKFTDGDKLYVRAIIEQAHSDVLWGGSDYNSKIMAGFLTIDPATISADGKSAQFTGDLDIYDGAVVPLRWDDELDDWVIDYENIEDYGLVYSPGTHIFTTADPLAECVRANAELAHAGSEAEYTVYDDNKSFEYDFMVASSVNELMTSSYRVGGEYDPDSHSFNLWANDMFSVILNCTISGLTPGASYTVGMFYGETEDYDRYDDYEGKVAADGEGKATFAILTMDGDYYYQLALSNIAEHKVVTLGRKALETKVYNITATATDYVSPAGAPIVSGTAAWLQYGEWYSIEEDPADVTISGSFTGYFFDIQYGGTVKLNNVTASYDDNCIIYSYSDERDLTVVLTGDNSLSSKENYYALGSNKDIKLMCTGSSATLTVTAQGEGICGIHCHNFPGDGDKPDPSLLAADGYTVALTNTVNGPDSDEDGEPDYYTWTYTVTR